MFDAMTTTAVSLKDVHLTLPSRAGNVDILRGVDLTVMPGEALGIVGPSGSGKTTLLMVIAGLERASRGFVSVAGTGSEGKERGRTGRLQARQRRHRLPVLPSHPHHDGARERRRAARIPRRSRTRWRIATEKLKRVGLGHRLTHYPGQLSGGEQQRVAIARALASGAKIIIADEPTGNLDHVTGEQIIKLLFDLKQQDGAALLLVTHDRTLAERCDRVAEVLRWKDRGRGAARSTRMNLALWLRFAARDLRSGLQGFWIFLTCLALGTGTIAIIGSLSAAIERGLDEQGQPLLGGDVEFSLIHRETTDPELAFISSKGDVSKVATVRAMAVAGENTTLVEAKAVDANYPLYGKVELDSGMTLADALATRDGIPGAVADPLLMGRLGLKPGDRVKLGSIEVAIRALIKLEPDRISDGIVLGPRLLVTEETLRATGIVQPGSLITWRYRVKLPDPSPQSMRAVMNAGARGVGRMPAGACGTATTPPRAPTISSSASATS